MTTITVALDSSLQRDIEFFTGDDMSITLIVYAHDGDALPITPTNVRFTAAAGSLPLTTPFTVPSNYIGRAAYRIVGEVEGITTTLVYGVLSTQCGWPDLCCGGYGHTGGNSWGAVAKADNVSLIDEGAYFAALASVEEALQELGAFKALISAQVPQWGTIGGNIATQTDLQAALAAKGYLGVPQNSQSTAYTLVLSDAGKHIFHPNTDVTARIWTIPANAAVAFPIGTAVTFVNENLAGVITIAINSDVLRLAGAGTSGSRTLAANGLATAVKYKATEWLISGTGLT